VKAALFFLALMVSQPALGCEYDPFLFQLPGETDQVAQARSERIAADASVLRHFDREKYDFEHAASIFLARVTAKAPARDAAGKLELPSTTVRPLTALKGSLPTSVMTLTDDATGGGMCTDFGDGHGAWSKVSDLVVVFAGLPKTRDRPRGVDSFDVSDIRTVELLDKLRAFGKDLED
jgi:hypothetical protein